MNYFSAVSGVAESGSDRPETDRRPFMYCSLIHGLPDGRQSSGHDMVLWLETASIPSQTASTTLQENPKDPLSAHYDSVQTELAELVLWL